MTPVEKLLDSKAVAERLNISHWYAQQLMARGDIGVTRIGRRVRVTEESLAAFVASRTAKPRSSRKGAAA